MGLFSRWWKRRLDLDEEDFQAEIRAHLRLETQERIAGGADPEEARYAALREFGNVTKTTEAARRVWTPGWLEALRDLTSDGPYAVRALAKNPLFSLTVIAVLAVGIGLNAAVFTMLKGFAISPIAGVSDSSHIAVIYAETSTGRPIRLSYPDYQYFRDHDAAFSGLFGTSPTTFNLGRGRHARQVWGEIVTGNYFPILGVRAQLGRTLLPSDEVALGRHPVVVLSDGLWRRDFAADPAIVGRTIDINNHPLTVVGVLDAAFHGTTVVYDVELYVPVMMAPLLGYTFGSQEATPAGILNDRRSTFFFPQGYLRPGTTMATAAIQTKALWATRVRDLPKIDAAERVEVVPFLETPGGAPTMVLPTVGVLSAMGLLVLLIACANIAGLVLVRGVSRRGEIALRLALGASRARVVRLLVVENLLLAIPGAALGILFARNTIPVLAEYAQWLAAPQRVFFNTEVDAFVIAYVALVGCASALVFGFVPALQSSRVDLVSVINEDASPRGAARGRLRAALVVAQVAVSLTLLVGSGLLTRSVAAARRTNPGFDPTQVTSVSMDLRQNGYDAARGRIFYRKLLDAARAAGGVDAATLAVSHPLALLETRAQRVTIDGYQPREGEDMAFSSNVIASDYFRTLRIPLLAGREFSEQDDERARLAVIVNRTFAQRFLGGPDRAVGRQIRTSDGATRLVIGVAEDLKYARINESPRPYYYLPFQQAYRPSMYLHTHGRANDERLVAQARAVVEALDPELPVLSARPMAEEIKGAFIFLDLGAMMLLVFGAAGMSLAALGTYGLVSYSVKQRTHEIGIRLVLGATARSVVVTFLTRGLAVGAAGAVLGVGAALAIGGLLRRVLFGVSATDPLSFVQALLIVLGGVALATVVPAWRASRTDPMTALRHH